MGLSLGLTPWVAMPQDSGGEPLPSGTIGTEGWKLQEDAARAEPDPEGNPEVIVVSRPGYTASGLATTVDDGLVKMKLLRQVYPNGATLVDDTVSLSDFVYASDTVPGITNGSTKAYPKPVCAWVSEEHQYVSGTTLTLRLFVAHAHGRNGTPAAAVRFEVSDGTTTAQALVSALTPVVMPLTGHTVPCYEATVDISALTDGQVTADAIVYPHVGDSTFQASVDGQPYPSLTGWSTQRHLKDTGGSLIRYAYVDAVSGSNSTGTTATTYAAAAAAPFATLQGAMNDLETDMGGDASGAAVYLMAGQTHSLGASLDATTVTGYPIRIIGEGSGAGRARVIDDGAGGADKVPDLSRWENLIIQRGSSATNCRFLATNADSLTNAAEHRHVLVDCLLDLNGQTTQNGDQWVHDCGLVMMYHCQSNWGMGMENLDGNYDNIWHIVGCTGIAHTQVNHAIGCFCDGGLVFTDAVTSKRQRHFAPVVAFNKFETDGSTNNVKLDDYPCGPEGVAVVGNVGAQTGASNDDNVEFFGSAPEQVENAIVAHNSFVGAQTNGPRDNKSTASAGEFTVAFHGNIVEENILNADYDISSDRQANWPQRFGVARSYNLIQTRSFGETGFGHDRLGGDVGGLGCYYGAPDGGKRVAFVNDASAKGSNDHVNGDYTPDSGHVNFGNLPRLPASAIQTSHDLDGTAVPTDGSALCGGVQL